MLTDLSLKLRKLAQTVFMWILGLPIISELVFQFRGIPLAAKLYLETFGEIVFVQVARRGTLITRDFATSWHIFKENGMNYTSRMAEDAGGRSGQDRNA